MAMTNRKFDDVYNLPRGVYTGTAAPVAIKDPIYPRKAEVHRGSKFVFCGHSVDEPTIWIVEDIITVTGKGRDRVRSSVDNVRMLDDIVELRRERPFLKKRIRFRTLSYMAAWRILE